MLPVEDEGHVENEEHAVDDGGAGEDVPLRARVPAPRRPRGRQRLLQFLQLAHLEKDERVVEVVDVGEVVQLGVPGAGVREQVAARERLDVRRGPLAAAAHHHAGRRRGARAGRRHATRGVDYY